MNTYRRLLQFSKPYRLRLAAAILFGLLSAGATGLTFYVINQVLGKTFETRAATMEEVFFWAALIPLLFLADGACHFANSYFINWVGYRVVFDVRNRIFAHFQTLSLDFHNRAEIGQLISRVIADAQVIEKAVSTTIVDMTKQPFTLAACLGAMFYLDWKLTAITLAVFPLCLIPIVLLGHRVRKASKLAQLKLADLVGVLHETLTGIRVVKAFQMEASEIRRFEIVNRGVFSQRMRAARNLILLNPIIMFVASFGIAAVLVYAYWRQMNFAAFTTFMFAAIKMYEPVKQLSRVWAIIQESGPPAERIFEILDEKPTVVEAADAKLLPPVQRSVSFDRVTFGYNSSAVLREVSLEIPVGQFVAVVGPSGAGKTSLANLLARFYDPTDGVVKFDGQDIRHATLQSLRSQIGIVTQETILFNDTIASNIAYGRPNATRAEIEAAAKKAHAHDFILERPDGYESVVGEKGIQLSGGQRQRIAIARAILKNPPILILDEATSALDTEQERAVQEALDELMRGRTVFAIAHRLSTVQHAHRILVLDGGSIAESGTHAELLAKGGLYKKLYDLQFKNA